ncbi:MAG: septum formation initiator family protein [Rhodospirillales bacterium]
MGILREIRKRQRHVIVPLLFAVVFGYLGYHVMHGERGVFAYMHLKTEIIRAEGAVAETDATRLTWERRVASMRNSTLDPDTVDERARVLLNVVRPDEIVIPLGKR